MTTKATMSVQALMLASLLLPSLRTEPQKSEVEGKQLTAVMSASNWIVRPGQRITLTLELELKPKMHIYASGAKGYAPIEWKMKDSALGTFDAPVYPKPQTLFLPAVNETVPVYATRVRLTRDITIVLDPRLKTPANGPFTIEGTL